jgi:hypothetical protein
MACVLKHCEFINVGVGCFLVGLLLEFDLIGVIFLSFLQETRKRKGLKEGLPDLSQYLDKL